MKLIKVFSQKLRSLAADETLSEVFDISFQSTQK